MKSLFPAGVSKSHPVWVRGLKLIRGIQHIDLVLSHPVWVRGLKLLSLSSAKGSENVAPRVGAWIETPHYPDQTTRQPVAPRVGAWIETRTFQGHYVVLNVAPRVGAWIETGNRRPKPDATKSHPVWVRGLKLKRAFGRRKTLGRTPCGCVD